MAYPNDIDKFTSKLNKKPDNSFYVIEEEIFVTGGLYEGTLRHDNVSASTINVYTAPAMGGMKVNNVVVTVSADEPWKMKVKIYTNEPKVYITYETQGDQVEADDVNALQSSMTATQQEVERYKASNDGRMDALTKRVKNVEETKADTSYVDQQLNLKADKATTYTKNETDSRIQAVVGGAPANMDTLKEISQSINNDPNFAGTMQNELFKKVDKVAGKGLSTNDYTNDEKAKLGKIEAEANKYILPEATQSTLGGVKGGNNVILQNGVLSVPEATLGIAGVTRLTNIPNSDSETTAATPKIVKAVADKLVLHEANNDNPHKVTKQQVGLGNLNNYTMASLEEAMAGTSNIKYMTPLLVAKALMAGLPMTIGMLGRNTYSSKTSAKDIPNGITSFLSYNAAVDDRFNELQYCTVINIKGYPDSSGGESTGTNSVVTQVILPFQSTRKEIAYRTSYNGVDGWSPYYTLETTEGAQGKVDALQVGGRNLCTFKDETKTFNFNTWQYYVADVYPYGIQMFSRGGKFTISGYFEEYTAGSNKIGLIITIYKSANDYIQFRSSDADAITVGKKGLVKYTFDIPTGSVFTNASIGVRSLDSAIPTNYIVGKISGVKLEKGAKATDFTLAPEYISTGLFATNAQAIVGENTDRIMSPLRTLQSIQRNAKTSLTQGYKDNADTTLNPIILTDAGVPSTSTFFYVETTFFSAISVNSNRKQTAKGYSNNRIYERVFINSAWSSWVEMESVAGAQAKVDAHANLKNNPHGVTKEQLGLGNVTNVQQASQADLTAHVDNNVRHIQQSEREKWDAKSNLALGETSVTAYRGDRGKTAFDHSQQAHAPANAQKNSDITKAEIEAKLTGNITTHTHSQYVTQDQLGNAGYGDMLKSVYDKNGNGIVDMASVLADPIHITDYNAFVPKAVGQGVITPISAGQFSNSPWANSSSGYLVQSNAQGDSFHLNIFGSGGDGWAYRSYYSGVWGEWVTWETKAGAQAKVDAHANNTKIHVTEADKTYWSGHIGGVNLLVDTNMGVKRWDIQNQSNSGKFTRSEYIGADGVRAYKLDVTEGPIGWRYSRFNQPIEQWKKLRPNRRYTLSLDILTDKALNLDFTICTGDQKLYLVAINNKVTVSAVNVWTRVSVPLVTNDLTSTISLDNLQTLYISGLNEVGLKFIKNLKLEEGYRATDWRPNDADFLKKKALTWNDLRGL